MMRHERFRSRAVLAVTSLALAVACDSPVTSNAPPGGSDRPGGNPPGAPPPSGSTIQAKIVALDASQPSLPAGATLAGTATFTGLSVELWDGQAWLEVTDGSKTTATIDLADAAAEATLVPTRDIPAGSYTKLRLSATDVVVDLSLMWNGQQLSAQMKPAGKGPFVLERNVDVVRNSDGTTTFRVALQMVRTLDIVRDPVTGAVSLSLSGDFGGGSVSASMAASVAALDTSQPTLPDGATSLTGTATFTGLSVELWDGESWLDVTDGSRTSATLDVVDGAAEATLVPIRDIPSGDYTKMRLTATDVVVDLTLVWNGKPLNMQMEPAGDDPFVLEKEMEVVRNSDGTTTFRIELELVRQCTVDTDPASGEVSVSVSGDLGDLQASS